MKEFHLSSLTDRIYGVLFSAVMIPMFALLLYALRQNIALLCVTAVCVLLVGAGLVLYVVNVLKSRCIADPEGKQLHVKGFRDYTLDLSHAVMLETLPIKTGQNASRVLYFTDAEGNIVASLPTMFTSRRGVMAEPMAMELAQTLGIDFRANLEPWEYDENKRKEHLKQVALEQKEENKRRAKERAELRKKKRMNKRKDK